MKEKIQKVLDIVVCILLIVVTISKGGFYKEDIAFPTTVISVMGCVYVIIKIISNVKENGIVTKNKLVTLLDLLMILLPISYFLPVIFGKCVTLENSIFEAIRYTNVSVIYYITRTSKEPKIYLNLLLAIAVIIAAMGLDEITYRVVEKLNLHINYLPQNGSIVSSVVQYANIAAILMILGINIAIYKFGENKNWVYIFIIVFLQSLVFLTTSRMALVLSGLVLATSVIIFIKRKQFHCVVGGIIVFLLSLCVSGVVSGFVDSKLNAAVYAIYALFAVVAAILNIKREPIQRVILLAKKFFSRYKKVSIYITLVMVALILLAVLRPTALTVYNTTKSVKITEFDTGYNTISLNIEKDDLDTAYTVRICKVYSEDYKSEEIFLFKSGVGSTENINQKIYIEDSIKYIQVYFEVKNGGITVNDMQLNNKDITMSYAFLPDRLASRLKNGFVMDLNNTLRYEYYKDGVKLWKNSPIIGIGGEGFKTCYQNVQQTTYISSEAHSGFIQTLVEAGIVGATAYILIMVLAIVSATLLLNIDRKNLVYLMNLLVIYIMATFDLTFSFAICTYILAVIIGGISNRILNTKQAEKYLFRVDNKSFGSMLRLGALCIITIVLVGISKYTIDVYNAGMITVTSLPDKKDEAYADKLYERVTMLEKKLQLDKYNLDYMLELNASYGEYIKLLKEASLAAISENEKSESNSLLANYILRQKTNVDNMIECEYFNKYALEKVAICYFENYIRYADILSNNFEGPEVAYAFYLNYAMKLTNRIIELGPKNKVARAMYEDILNTYIDTLSVQNKYIQSITIDSVIRDMKNQLINLT